MNNDVNNKQPFLERLLDRSKKTIVYTFLFSAVINVLFLILPLYTLQLFDRVLSSRSYETLFFLSMIALFGLLVLGSLLGTRTRLLNQLSQWIDKELGSKTLETSIERSMDDPVYSSQAQHEVKIIKDFLGGAELISFLDSPWVIIFIMAIYFLHPLIGVIVTIGVVVLLVISFLNSYLTKVALANMSREQIQNQALSSSVIENSEPILAMGMVNAIVRMWYKRTTAFKQQQITANQRLAFMVSTFRFVRLSLQVMIMGTGAYLVINNQLTPGGMIAGSILAGRAFSPLEAAVNVWKNFTFFKEAYRRIKRHLSLNEGKIISPLLSEPQGTLTVDIGAYFVPERKEPIIQGINFNISEGACLCVIGSSGAGKTTLMKHLAGVIKPTRGRVDIGGYDVNVTEKEAFGKFIGYLPQSVNLLPGSILENIARMDYQDQELVYNAAKLAGAHEFILSLPYGYETSIYNSKLSSGQQQRIALARAFYNNPKIILLDEPNAHLDEIGLAALKKSLKNAKSNKITIVMVTHSKSLLQLSDYIIQIHQGKQNFFQKKEVFFQKLQQVVGQVRKSQNDTKNQRIN